MTKYLILASSLVLVGCGSVIRIPTFPIDQLLFPETETVSTRVHSTPRVEQSAPLVDSIQESDDHWWDDQCKEEDYTWVDGKRIKPDNC